MWNLVGDWTRLDARGAGQGGDVGGRVVVVGADDIGRAAVDELRAEGVDVDAVQVLDGVPTGVALIVVDTAGENQIAVGAGANAQVDRDRVRAALVDALPHTGCVLVSTEI